MRDYHRAMGGVACRTRRRPGQQPSPLGRGLSLPHSVFPASCSVPRRGWPRGVQGVHVAAAAASEERRAAQGRGTRNKKEETLPVGNTIVWSASTWLFK